MQICYCTFLTATCGAEGCLTPGPGPFTATKRHGGPQGRSGRVRKFSLVRDSVPDCPSQSESLRYATPEKREEGSKFVCPKKEASSIGLTIGSEVTSCLLVRHDQPAVRLRFEGNVRAHWSYEITRAIRPTLKVGTLSVTGSSTGVGNVNSTRCR